MTFHILFYEHDPVLRRDIGGFRKAWVLADHLGRLGHRVLVFGPKGTAPPATGAVEAVELPYVDIAGLRPLMVYAQLFLRPLLAALAGRRPDVIYMRPLNSPFTAVLARLLGARLAYEVNGDSIALYEAVGASRLRLAFVRWMERLNVLGSDLVLPMTPGLERALIARHGLPPGRTRVIESAADTELFRPLPGDARRRTLGIEAAAPVIGFVGAFLAHQGVETLLAAAPRVLARCPSARFVLVGDGVMRRAWADRVERAGLGRAFVFTGQVPYHDVPGYIAAMDVCVAPFAQTRGATSPLKVFDYLACEKPTVASAIESVREMGEVPGVVAVTPDAPDALADAVLGLLADPARARELGAAGRRWVVARHTWLHVAKRVADLCARPAVALTPAPPPAEWPVVTAAVSTWNRRDDVLETLDGLVAMDYPADRLEILVRDDGSSDDTEAAVREWMATTGKGLRRTEVFRDRDNLGCAGGRNFLAARASADSAFVLVLDDDAVPEPGYLRALVRLALIDPRVGVVGSRIVTHAEPRADLAQAGVIDWRLVRFREFAPGGPVDCDYVSGCATLVRREAYAATGGFDEEYVAYHEDVDFGVRARRAGFRVVYEPAAAVRHKVPAGKRRTPYRLYYLFRNKVIFMHKHVSPWRRPLPWILYALAWPLLLVGQSLWVHRGARPAEWRVILRAVVDGLLDRRGPGRV